MGLGGVAIATLPSVIFSKLMFSDGLGGGCNLSLHEKHTELFKKAQRVSEKELSLFQKDEGMFPKGSFLRLL